MRGEVHNREEGEIGWKRREEGEVGWKRREEGEIGWKRREEGEIGWKSWEKGDLRSCTSPLFDVITEKLGRVKIATLRVGARHSPPPPRSF